MIRFPGVGGVRRNGRERVIGMQRVRRLASVAVVATLAVTGLAACRSAQDVAVYFGSGSEISAAEVQRVYDDARTKLTAAQEAANQSGQEAGAAAEAPATVQVPISGPDVVSAMVSRDVATRVAQQRNVALPAQLPLDEVAQSLGLPADTEYVRLYTEARLLFNLLLQNASAGPADDAAVRHVFDVFEATGAMQPGLTYEQFRSQVSPQALETLGKAGNVRNDVQAQLDELDVTVNPRYASSEIAVYTEPGPDNKPLSLVSVPLAGTNSAPVTDAA
jgi:hypothetical protein